MNGEHVGWEIYERDILKRFVGIYEDLVALKQEVPVQDMRPPILLITEIIEFQDRKLKLCPRERLCPDL